MDKIWDEAVITLIQTSDIRHQGFFVLLCYRGLPSDGLIKLKKCQFPIKIPLLCTVSTQALKLENSDFPHRQLTFKASLPDCFDLISSHKYPFPASVLVQ